MTNFEVSLVGGSHEAVEFEVGSVHFNGVDAMCVSPCGTCILIMVWGHTIDHIAITDNEGMRTAWLNSKGKETCESANGTPEIIWRQKEVNNAVL